MAKPRDKGECSVEECTNPAWERGWCVKHYERWRQHGDVTVVHKPGKPRALDECTVDGCGKTPVAKGYCTKHYQRWKKTGDPLIVQVDRDRTPEERFWSKVDKGGPVPERRPELGQCWVWTAGKNEDGYGAFWLDGRTHRAHRIAYKWTGAPLPDDLEIDHLCRTHACVRPDHLEPVTGAINNYRSDSPWGINSRKTHCPQNHEYTPENTYLYRGERHCRTCARTRTNEWIRRTGWKPKAQRKRKAA